MATADSTAFLEAPRVTPRDLADGGGSGGVLPADHTPEAPADFERKRTLLVTGVSGYWGQRLVRQVEQNPRYDRILGIDYVDPLHPFERCEFIPIDLLNPLLANLLLTEKVDAVCHLLFVPSRIYREELFKLNVLGTMRLLSACVKAGVSKVVLKSSTLVYGAAPERPMYMPEDHALTEDASHQYVKDLVDIENFCAVFAKSHPEISAVILRFAGVLGPSVETSLTHYLSRRLVPVAMGFDPLLQLIHEDDVVAAIGHALNTPGLRGAYNVAADGTLPLRRIVRLLGSLPLPLPSPALAASERLLGWVGVDFPDRLDTPYLQFPCTADTGAMHARLGFHPERDLPGVVDAFRAADDSDVSLRRYAHAGNHRERLKVAVRRKTL